MQFLLALALPDERGKKYSRFSLVLASTTWTASSKALWAAPLVEEGVDAGLEETFGVWI